MDEVSKINAKFKADIILKLLENNQIAISQLSFDLGEIKKEHNVKMLLLNLDLKNLRERLDKLEGELESLFKK